MGSADGWAGAGCRERGGEGGDVGCVCVEHQPVMRQLPRSYAQRVRCASSTQAHVSTRGLKAEGSGAGRGGRACGGRRGRTGSLSIRRQRRGRRMRGACGDWERRERRTRACACQRAREGGGCDWTSPQKHAPVCKPVAERPEVRPNGGVEVALLAVGEDHHVRVLWQSVRTQILVLSNLFQKSRVSEGGRDRLCRVYRVCTRPLGGSTATLVYVPMPSPY